MQDDKIFKEISHKGLKLKVSPEVYEPAEDSFLLAEAVEINKDMKILEIGTGTGIISLDCCRMGANVVCSDVNPFAVKLADINFNLNLGLMKGSFEVRHGDLFSVVKKGEVFDVVIFNPPYLPTRDDERVGGSGWFDVATDGGLDGLNVTFRFINGLKKCLSKEGRAYFVFSSLSDRVKLERKLSDENFCWKVVNSCSFDDEQLDVYRIGFLVV